jgi:hypothetical protein
MGQISAQIHHLRPKSNKLIVNVDIRAPLVERKLCIGLIMDLFLPNNQQIDPIIL